MPVVKFLVRLEFERIISFFKEPFTELKYMMHMKKSMNSLHKLGEWWMVTGNLFSKMIENDSFSVYGHGSTQLQGISLQ